jgi:hypothetical protein
MTIDGRSTARRSTASSYWRLGQQQSGMACAGEGSREALRRWQSFPATCGAVLEQELASGGAATAASGGAATAVEKTEEGEGGGS